MKDHSKDDFEIVQVDQFQSGDHIHGHVSAFDEWIWYPNHHIILKEKINSDPITFVYETKWDTEYQQQAWNKTNPSHHWNPGRDINFLRLRQTISNPSDFCCGKKMEWIRLVLKCSQCGKTDWK